MVIVAEQIEPKKRRAPWWVLAFVLAGLLPVGVFAWSLSAPVIVPLGSHELDMKVVSAKGRFVYRAGSGYFLLILPLPYIDSVYYISFLPKSDSPLIPIM
jgi:hypothetical protein